MSLDETVTVERNIPSLFAINRLKPRSIYRGMLGLRSVRGLPQETRPAGSAVLSATKPSAIALKGILDSQVGCERARRGKPESYGYVRGNTSRKRVRTQSDRDGADIGRVMEVWVLGHQPVGEGGSTGMDTKKEEGK